MLCVAAGLDYVAVNEVVMLSSSNTLATVPITTRKDDLTNERAETFNVTLSSSITSTLSLEPRVAIVSICM